MKIYLAMIADRHADTEPFPFSTADRAIAYARGWAVAAARFDGDFQEPRVPGGWLYYATYSPESDSVWVVEKALDAPEGA
jgi:hypothetical protein